MKFRLSSLPLSFALAALAFGGTVIVGSPRARADNAAPVVAQKPIIVPGGPGGYDWMTVDTEKNRLLATHKGKGTLVVLDLADHNKITSIPVGAAQGIAIDPADDKYFVGDADEQKIVILDRNTLKKTGEIAVTGPVDAIAFDPKRGLIYADHDDGGEVWVIDAKTEKILAAVKVSGAPEYIEYDPITDRLYQNVKTDDTLHVIDSEKRTVEAVWKTTPATGPHGLAISSASGRVYSAGKNGKLTVLDIKTGKQIAVVDIPPGVDQIAFDPGNKRVYSACKGFISVVEETADGARLLANIPAPAGVHTLTVDPATHTVWASYADAKESYLLAFSP